MSNPRMGLNDFQLREEIIVEALHHIDAISPAAIQLVLNTAKQESHLKYLKQLEDGPAIGLWQMEPATHNDIYEHYLNFRPELRSRVTSLAIGSREVPDPKQMAGNLYYACAMCRVHYLRVKDPLPAADDLHGQAHYWKTHYNTHLGAGHMSEFLAAAGMDVSNIA